MEHSRKHTIEYRELPRRSRDLVRATGRRHLFGTWARAVPRTDQRCPCSAGGGRLRLPEPRLPNRSLRRATHASSQRNWAGSRGVARIGCHSLRTRADQLRRQCSRASADAASDPLHEAAAGNALRNSVRGKTGRYCRRGVRLRCACCGTRPERDGRDPNRTGSAAYRRGIACLS